MPIQLLGISGSLRPESSNTAVLRALAELAPAGVDFSRYEGLGSLPPFDPGLELTAHAYHAPSPVMALREALARANGVIFCTPEYAFGMPGVLKNALDWTVSMAVLERKPVAAIAASPSPSGGDKAHQGLLWVLTALGAEIVEEASFALPHIRSKLNAHGDLTDPATRDALAQGLHALLRNIQTKAAR